MAAHPVKGSHGGGPHNAGQSIKVYDHRREGKKVTTKRGK